MNLNNVENTKLSTWTGSTAITTLGTISTGTIPWANISGKPSQATAWPNWGQILQSGANNIEEGTSDFTDNTEIFSSYASNNGFADTNATGKVYRRDAIKLYNYIKGKTDSLYVNVSGDTMTGALNFANGTYNKVGDDVQIGDVNKAGRLGIKGLNGATGIEFVPYSGSTSQTFSIDGTGCGTLTGLFAISNSNNTVTIGSQNANFTHIYNSANVPFIFNKNILVTGKANLGDESYPFGRLQLGTANDGIYYKGSKANYRMIRMIDNTSDTYGNGIGIGGGGLVVIGAGEFADNLISTKSLAGGGEETFIGADGSIFVEAGGNTIANRVGIQIDTSGNIVPIKAETGNNNVQSLGTSSYKWANVYATTFNGALSGNASTATTLQTTRTINGTNFNGSANITTANWGTARTLTIGSTGKSVNGSADISWTLAEIGAAASGHTHTTTIATSSGTSQLTLAFGTKYSITAGGTSYIFTMPANPNTDKYVLQSVANADKWRKVTLGEQYEDSLGVAVSNKTSQVYVNPQLEFNTSSGVLNSTKFLVNKEVTLEYNSTTESLDFVF